MATYKCQCEPSPLGWPVRSEIAQAIIREVRDRQRRHAIEQQLGRAGLRYNYSRDEDVGHIAAFSTLGQLERWVRAGMPIECTEQITSAQRDRPV